MAFLSNINKQNANALTVDHPMSSFSQPRASYSCLSYNTSNGQYSTVYFDAEFQKMAYTTNLAAYGHSGSYGTYNGTYENVAQFMYNISNTASLPSSNGTSTYINATNVMGEFGNYLAGVTTERGNTSGYQSRWRTTSTTTLGRMQRCYVNSDHSNRNKVLMFDGLNLESMPMWMPFTTSGWGASYPSGERKTKTFTAANLGGGTNNMYGSASYNNVRKELVILNYNSATTGRFDVSIWKNIDFDANDLDVTQVPSTPTHQFSVTTPNFVVNNAESQRNIKVVLTDNGDIYYSVMYTSNAFNLYRIVRATGDASGTVSQLQTQALTTSYGIEQGNEYGQVAMKTRLGNMVMTFCPYYYYGSGIMSYVIDKRNNSWSIGYSTSDTSYGIQPMKYRDDSFCYYYAGNYYASNWTGAYIRGTTYPVSGSTPITTTSVIYLPTAPAPNTTNYPGMTHVWEFDLQTNLPGMGNY